MTTADPRDPAVSLRRLRDLKLGEIPTRHAAEVVARITRVEQAEPFTVAAFNSSID
jgi:FXSXX-COOH protein